MERIARELEEAGKSYHEKVRAEYRVHRDLTPLEHKILRDTFIWFVNTDGSDSQRPFYFGMASCRDLFDSTRDLVNQGRTWLAATNLITLHSLVVQSARRASQITSAVNHVHELQKADEVAGRLTLESEAARELRWLQATRWAMWQPAYHRLRRQGFGQREAVLRFFGHTREDGQGETFVGADLWWWRALQERSGPGNEHQIRDGAGQ